MDWLTDTDKDVLSTLCLVRVASTDQLRRLHFLGVTERSCQRCLARLGRQHMVVRLARRVGGVLPGSAPWAYALGVSGQRLLGLAGPRGGRVRRPWVPSPLFLRHALMVTAVYVTAVEISRRHPLALTYFAAEPECWRPLPDHKWLKPDAELTLAADEYEDHYFIEVDRATESPAALKRKMNLYAALFQSGQEQARTGVFPKVLYVVPSPERAAQIRQVITRLPKEFRPLFAAVVLKSLAHFLVWRGDKNTE